MAAEHDAEPPVSFAAGAGRHAVDDFLLQHEVHVMDAVAAVDQVKQERRRDVVGQVADDPQGIAERTEIELERVRLVDDHVAPAVETALQRRRQVAVQFDAVKPARFLRERLRDGALPGSDLHDGVLRLRIDGADDRVDGAGIGQEVLAESLARSMRLHRRSASRAAISTAATRLPGSARPVPARSNAVP